MSGPRAAIAASILGRIAQAAAQAGLIAATARWLDAHEQGYYASMRSLVALQVFLELGMTTVIVQFASHEHALASGDDALARAAAARLASVLRLAVRWYGRAALVLVAVVTPAGIAFFASAQRAHVSWLLPWCAVAAGAGVGMRLLPYQAVIDGTGGVASMATMRGCQAVVATAVYALIAHRGGGLMALAGYALSAPLVGGAWILLAHRAHLRRVAAGATHEVEAVDWRREMWPFQRRIAVSWASGYLIAQLFVPALFRARGEVEAGRFGLTMDACTGLASLGMAMVAARMPAWGGAVARREYHRLDRDFALTAVGAAALVTLGAAAALAVRIAFSASPSAQRFLDPPTSALLLAAAIGNVVVFAFAGYLRAHKREPFMVPSLVGALCVSAWIVISVVPWGATGIAVGYAAITATVGVGWGALIWTRQRRDHLLEGA